MDAATCVITLAQMGAGTHHGPAPSLDATAAWPAAVDLAIQHRVAPLVWQALADAAPGTAPEHVVRTLDERMWWSRGARMLCEHALESLLELAAGEGIDVLVLKGASLAHTLYPNPDLRPYHDLDVLCRPVDQPRLYRALLAAGYTSEEIPQAPAIAGRSAPVRTFVDPSGTLDIEVHSDALQFGLAERHHDDLWRDARSVAVGAVAMRILSPAHQFLHLASHAHRHCYSRLLWLIDLDLFIRREGDALDWDSVMALARDEGIGPIVRYALAVTHALLGTPLPALPVPTVEERLLETCYRWLWPIASVKRLERKEHRRLLYFHPETADPREVLYGLFLLGRRREKVRILRQRWLRLPQPA